jgi:hypothetical protein
MKKRSQIFKELKALNAYKKEHFKLKVPELLDILKKVEGISITEPVFDDDEEVNHVDSPKESVQSLVKIVPEIPLRVSPEIIPVKTSKKIKKEIIQKIVKPAQKIGDYRKLINSILKNFGEEVYDLLIHFDDGDLTDVDEEILRTEFNKLYDTVSEEIEKILDEFNVEDKNFIALIEKKIKLQIRQYELFVS